MINNFKIKGKQDAKNNIYIKFLYVKKLKFLIRDIVVLTFLFTEVFRLE